MGAARSRPPAAVRSWVRLQPPRDGGAITGIRVPSGGSALPGPGRLPCLSEGPALRCSRYQRQDLRGTRTPNVREICDRARFRHLSGAAPPSCVSVTGRCWCTAADEYAHGVMSRTLSVDGQLLPPDYALEAPADYLDALYASVAGASSSRSTSTLMMWWAWASM